MRAVVVRLAGATAAGIAVGGCGFLTFAVAQALDAELLLDIAQRGRLLAVARLEALDAQVCICIADALIAVARLHAFDAPVRVLVTYRGAALAGAVARQRWAAAITSGTAGSAPTNAARRVSTPTGSSCARATVTPNTADDGSPLSVTTGSPGILPGSATSVV